MVRLTPRLVAIFLVEKTTSGANFVFHWPLQPQVRLQATHHNNDSAESAIGMLDLDDSDDDENNRFTEVADDTHVLGYEKGFLANMLSPRIELCNQKFEIWVDGLTFLGCPVHIGPNGEWAKRRKPRTTVESNASSSHLVSKPESSHPSTGSFEVKSSSSKSRSSMSLFHVVFVLNVPTATVYRPTVNTMYDHIVVKLVTGLKYEQAKRNYVENECIHILKLTEKYSSQNVPFDVYAAQIPHHSNLASVLATTYEALINMHTAYLEINQSINLSLLWPMSVSTNTLENYELQVRPSTILASQTIFSEEHPSSIEPFVAPYWTLLLLKDTDTIMKRVPLLQNSLLSSFIAIVKPNLTFTDIANRLGISVSECFILAKHLIHWRKAIAIPPLLIRNTYVTSPTANLFNLEEESKLFKKEFPSLPSLSTFLAILSFKPRPFASIIPSKDHELVYLEMLAWLCRRNWVYEQNIYMYILVPEEIKKKAIALIESDESSKNDMQLRKQLEQDNGKESIIIDPHSASLLEQKWIQIIAYERGPEMAPLFTSIVKYLNGRFALQTIWVAEGLPRKLMRNILNEYNDYILRWHSW
ncbi:GATOR1-SEACIT GTPase activating complex subunit Npr3 [Schizosaccharomyces pombe]|uniref:Nitrogen permease regulator 3-like protein n=1 Tax=Schizosaccharomyces pombe (strain 972 / ATCC 24843) TaxID=284812 RepID=NPRL3_SCHPO|nr:putative Npr2/3 complex subunit Npr3 [Schizosaccharomyces pombe]Q9HGM7.1 RecName: Full=Nitrogen permease regulator 3-like protein [Schizosaccharomyces pombe 972h-]CAC05246.1 Npr2/3 complex subunit Npr3 (predicted) [Schizosaccharomyces pombe]|eukprot:NP_001342971.1 putative Npr2/3 complex subunit Npr3 [Schizosaccharomyces pombe]